MHPPKVSETSSESEKSNNESSESSEVNEDVMKQMQENIEAAFEHIGEMASGQNENNENNETDEETHIEKFKKVITEFMGDVVQTFPEYTNIIEKYADIEDETTVNMLFEHCKKEYLPQFFNIVYENDELLETEFKCLPEIMFKSLYSSDVSDTTQKILWKYVQLILFSCVNDAESGDMFGDSAKLFEAIDSTQLYEKLMETIDNLNNSFDKSMSEDNVGNENESDDSEDGDNKEDNSNKKNPFKDFLNADDLNKHLEGIMNGKIGTLAKEIASDAMDDMKEAGIDMENPKDMMNTMFKNPTKLFSLMKNIGTKIDKKIKDGSIKESELVSEATEIMDKFEDIPGLKNMMNSMGMGGKGGKMDMKGMMNRMQTHMRQSQTRERMLDKLKKKREAEAAAKAAAEQVASSSDKQEGVLLQSSEDTYVFRPEEGETVMKSSKKPKNKKKKKKSKK